MREICAVFFTCNNALLLLLLLLLLSDSERQSTSCHDRYQSSPTFISSRLWLPTVQIRTHLTTKDGEECSSRSTKFMTSMNTDVIFIQIDQHLEKLLPKYKEVPIL